MADFRKWFLVLAVLAAFVIPASAQVSATCNFAVSPTTVRSEGLAELTGDIQMVCDSPAGATNTNFTAIFSAPVTSTTSTLQVNAATPITGTQSGNTLAFAGVVIPTGSGNVIRIRNVRVNASSVGAGNSVFGTVTVNPASTVFFTNNPSGPVASVQQGLVFAADTKGNNAAPAGLQQCVTGSAKTVNVNFTEGFPSAFKNLVDEGIGATQPTRIFARFVGIPSSVVIGVPSTISAGTTGTATLVGFDETSTTSTTPTPVSDSKSPINGLVQVTPSSGTAVAVYEINTENPIIAETFVLPVTIALSSAGEPTTAPTIGGGFAPITTNKDVVPRFVDVSSTNSTSLLTISACVTNLLFPFVTNQAGFDTGIALVNTSSDNAGNKAPFNTTPQNGTCTVFYFNGTTTAPLPQVTANIPAGGMTAFTLQGGGVAGSTSSAAGFQGYIIARCNFQFAHGFAFISDRNTPSLGSQGYLALVIPDRARVAKPFSLDAATGQGEQLAQ